ncbi:outer membrane protein assembly factor BamC [Robbsia sp. KACC 23696]|uniref:outer membrane protein assembly factor BamC n=1 Tax=Robbsia sp. KACC 23696 TaxID=3149231 RepID=UPI00325B3109
MKLKAYRPAMAVLALSTVASLSGCAGLKDKLAGDKVDYSNATSVPDLKVPAGLAQPKIETQYVAPPVAAVNHGPQMSITQDGAKTVGLPTAQDPLGMHVVKDSDQQWLIVDGRSPEELWPELKTFWADNGFVIALDSPTTGVMETDWAENRAKIPQDWFRRTFGKLVDGIYSSGTRDKFRTRLEHTADGGTAIYITQHGMVEKDVGTGNTSTSTRWQDSPRNPQLELAFMGRLMERFGLSNAQAKQLIVSARPADARVVSLDTSSGAPILRVNEPVDRTWLRVGLALDRSDFLVDESNQQTGTFVVRYSNPVDDNARTSGIFGKLFKGSATKGKGAPLHVAVRPDAAGRAQVMVLDTNGQPDDSREARRLVTLLQAQLS